MSTDHYVHCLPCKSTENYSDEVRYHSTDALKLLIKHATIIGNLAPLMLDPVAINYELELGFYSLGRVNVTWFAEHALHELTIIDEYGSLLDAGEDT